MRWPTICVPRRRATMTEHQSDRRQFAKKVGQIAAALGLSSFEMPELFQPARAETTGQSLNWALIGTGSRSLDLLRPLSTITVGRCVALCDIYRPNLEKGAKTIGGAP